MMGIQSVDKLEIQVLVDNVTDSLSSVPEKTVKDMEWFKWRAVNALGNRFGDGVVVPSAVGRIYDF